MAILDELAAKLYGRSRAEENIVSTDATTRTYIGTATSDSSDGSVYVALSEDVTMPDDYDGEHGTGVEMPTTVGVSEGDDVVVTVFGGGTMKAPVVTGNPGWGDDVETRVTEAHDLAASVEGIAQEAAAEVEQVRQDVADFRSDVATTYATKVEREDGDDAVKTWVTTNYTNSNDLATTYATKTLVSQTKDAIELAASQTYETQSDAAATYATKSALTVGLDGIRTEVAEDYQPKGDYATTASMNSAIQQSASSIESSVAATYETKSDAATTYATKTEVQQTASGLDTRITTAQSTADGAASTASTASSNATAALNKVNGLQVGGTNLASDVKLWYGRTASSFYVGHGITVKQLGDGLYSAIGTTTGSGDIWFQTSNIDASLSRDPGDYVMSVYVESGTWPSKNFLLQLAAYKSSDNTWSRNIRTANGSTSQAFTCETDYPRHFGFYSNTSGVEVNITFRLKLERGTIATDWSPAPEDMATEADLQAEVTERQTLIRQFSGGVLAGYVGNAIAALVNAAGSFDVVRTAWSGGVPSILGTLATFGANLIRIGEETGQNVLITSAGQFFRNGLNNLLALLPAHYRTDEFTGDGTTTAFTLTVTPYEVMSVTVAGVALADEDWSASGDVVTLTTAPADGDAVSVTYRTSSTSIGIFDGRGNESSNVVAEFSEDGVTVGRTSSLNSFFNNLGIYFRNGVNNLLSLVAGKHYYHESNVTYGSTPYVSLAYYPVSIISVRLDGVEIEGYEVHGRYVTITEEYSGKKVCRVDYRASPTLNMFAGDGSSSLVAQLSANAVWLARGGFRINVNDGPLASEWKGSMSLVQDTQHNGGMALGVLSNGSSYVTLEASGTGSVGDLVLYSDRTLDFTYLDNLRFLGGTVTTGQALIALQQPYAMFTGSSDTATSSANGWRITWFNTVYSHSANWSDYFSFSNGVITAKKNIQLEISGCMNWTDSVAGSRGFGVFVNSSTVSSGTEYSEFQMFPSGVGTRKSVWMTGLVISLNAGVQCAIGRYENKGAVYVNGTNYSRIELKVLGTF